MNGFEPDVGPPKQWDELVAADEAGDLERVSQLAFLGESVVPQTSKGGRAEA